MFGHVFENMYPVFLSDHEIIFRIEDLFWLKSGFQTSVSILFRQMFSLDTNTLHCLGVLRGLIHFHAPYIFTKTAAALNDLQS